MRGNSVILVIGKEEKQTLPMLLTLRQLICPLPFPLLWPTSQWPLTIINWLQLMLMTSMRKKKGNKRPLIQDLPTKEHDTLEERSEEKREKREAAGVKQLKAVKLLALVQTLSGLLWSEIHLRLLNRADHTAPPPPDWPVTASSFNPTLLHPFPTCCPSEPWWSNTDTTKEPLLPNQMIQYYFYRLPRFVLWV